MKTKTAFILLLLLCSLTLLSPGVTLAAPTFEKAIDQLFAQGYPQSAESYLNSLGTSSLLGFRWAGTSADNEAAEYLAEQLRTMGLSNVRLEPVPVDVCEFRSASVTVSNRTMIASPFAGVPATPPEGLTGEVVYVHNGTAADYEGVDVKGKLVLVDSAFNWWWLNYPGAEATHQGAMGVIMTDGPFSDGWYAVARDALGSNDGQYDLSFAPMVYISRQDGYWLKAQLAAGPVTATMQNDVQITLADDGGIGYNVIGELPGTVPDDEIVIIGSHKDAHFRSALDDTGAVVNGLAIAKAMKTSDYHPKHTVVFLFTTAEEFGYTNAWYDWSSGAWYAITQTHTDWPGRVAAFINLEMMAGHLGSLYMETTSDLVPWLEKEAAAASDLLFYGYSVNNPEITGQDGWTFTAAGVPSIMLTASGTGTYGTYHTDYETEDLIDWENLAQIAKFVFRLDKRLDEGILPYSLKARADDLTAAVSTDDLLRAGAAQDTVNRLNEAISRFRKEANRYEVLKAVIPTKAYPILNRLLMQLEKTINGNFTALDVWGSTIYPHEQVLWDIQHLNQALSALGQEQPAPDTALEALGNVGLTSKGLKFSYEVYTHELTRHDPNYYRVTWGAQGHLAKYLDVIPAYHQIEAGDYAPAVASLSAMRDAEVADLNARLAEMSSVLESLIPQAEVFY